VTLGAWFREYLYIPLGGNRKGSLRTILNLAVVWLFTGLWHGVGGNYLLWAGFLFLLIVNERLWLGKLLGKCRILSHVYVVFMVLMSWLPFAVGNWQALLAFLGRLFCFSGAPINPSDYIVWGSSYAGLLIVGAVFMTPLPEKLWRKIRGHWISDIVLFVLFWVVVYYISTAAQDPFMYFQY
jgi:alginate O-acetyltransferase complex protein AlgI